MLSKHTVSGLRPVRFTTTSWLIKAAVASALAAAAAGSAFAQEAKDETAAPLQELVVTGSRIQRPDYKSDSPMVTLSSDNLLHTAEVGVDQQLNKLPQFVPGANQFTSASDVQSTPTNSPGISTVNLRGLGANRTLVLLDGRRTQPNNASLVVDLNTIPIAAIDSVEVITGGAGATYGADAVAGVVNFRLKRNFEGLTLDAQSGQTARGDGAQTQISALMGSNLADNRGNVLVGLNFARRAKIYSRDRPFFAAAFTDPGTAGVAPFQNFGGFSGAPTQAAVDSIFTAMGYASGDVSRSTTFYFNPAATTAGATLFSVAPGAISHSPAPGYTGAFAPDYKLLTNGSLASNAPNGFLSLPLTRYSMFASGHYDWNDHLNFYIQGGFNQNETSTAQGFSAPAALQWSVTVPYDAAHPVPAQLATLLDSRTAPTAPWSLQKVLSYLGPESLDTTTQTYELLTGIRGSIGVKDWTYDLFASHGNTHQLASYHGFADLAQYQALINLPNYGAGANFNNGRIGQVAHCTSGINPFVTTPVSQDCINIIQALNQTSTNLRQNQAELNVQGGLFHLPAGDLRFAVGADYRKNELQYQPAPGMSTTNITSLTIGLFDTTPTHGAISVSEGYIELLAPVLKDLPFVKSLNLDAGYRYSKYDTATGGVSTWKVTADWDVNGWVKFRGGRQVANRAPNVAELFQPATYLTVPWPDHDPCSIVTHAPFGNIASNPNRAQVQALCTALAGGFPIDSTFTGNQSVYFPLGRDLQQGNPNLKPEEAVTWTIGAVLRSPFEAAALRRLTLSVDYYKIMIDGAIAPATTATTYQECFNAFDTNPTYDPNNPFCKLILRSPTNGFWLATNALYSNLGSIKTSGVDAQIDWSADAPGLAGRPGSVFANINFNWLQAYDVLNVTGGPVLHYAGTIGSPISAPPYGAQFQWKLYTTLGYKIGPGTLRLNWRHLPGADNAAVATNSATTTLPTGSYDEFDLAADWSVNSKLDVRAGVDNLFDRAPNTVGVVPGSTTAAGVTDIAGSYDVLGRRYYLAVTARL